MERYGPRLLATLNAVSARLTTATLRYLNGRVQLAGMNPRTVASGWLRAQAADPGKAGCAVTEKAERNHRRARPRRPPGAATGEPATAPPPSGHATPSGRARPPAAPSDHHQHHGVAAPRGHHRGARSCSRANAVARLGDQTTPGCCA